MPHLVSAAKSEYQQVLADNEQAFHDHLEQKLNTSLGLIQVVLGVTNAALMSEPEEGELGITNHDAALIPEPEEGELIE